MAKECTDGPAFVSPYLLKSPRTVEEAQADIMLARMWGGVHRWNEALGVPQTGEPALRLKARSDRMP